METADAARQTGVIKHENPCFDLKFPESKAHDLYVTDEMFLFVRERAPTMIGYAMGLTYITAWTKGPFASLSAAAT